MDLEALQEEKKNLHAYLKAYERDDLFWDTIWWYIKNTGIPISFGTVVLMGVIVGIAIAGNDKGPGLDR